jgi:hypothetical protein
MGVVPLILWTLAAGALRVTGRHASIGSTWRRIALPVAVVVAAGHRAKGLAKSTSWAVFLPQALRDPSGTATVLALTAKAVPPPRALLSLPEVAVPASATEAMARLRA